MNFLILTPLSPRILVPHFWGGGVGGGGGGAKLLCMLRLLCVDLDLGPDHFFSCIWTPQPMAGVLGPNSGYPRLAPPMGPSQ